MACPRRGADTQRLHPWWGPRRIFKSLNALPLPPVTPPQGRPPPARTRRHNPAACTIIAGADMRGGGGWGGRGRSRGPPAARRQRRQAQPHDENKEANETGGVHGAISSPAAPDRRHCCKLAKMHPRQGSHARHRLERRSGIRLRPAHPPPPPIHSVGLSPSPARTRLRPAPSSTASYTPVSYAPASPTSTFKCCSESAEGSTGWERLLMADPGQGGGMNRGQRCRCSNGRTAHEGTSRTWGHTRPQSQPGTATSRTRVGPEGRAGGGGGPGSRPPGGHTPGYHESSSPRGGNKKGTRLPPPAPTLGRMKPTRPPHPQPPTEKKHHKLKRSGTHTGARPQRVQARNGAADPASNRAPTSCVRVCISRPFGAPRTARPGPACRSAGRRRASLAAPSPAPPAGRLRRARVHWCPGGFLGLPAVPGEVCVGCGEFVKAARGQRNSPEGAVAASPGGCPPGRRSAWTTARCVRHVGR